MFIFARPLRAVAAGLAVALLIVYADRCTDRTRSAEAQPAACAAPAGCGILRAGS
jgi:hypothetical protein